MQRYFALYPDNESKAIAHYKCNLQISEAMYVPLSIFEVTLRNALSRELEQMTNSNNWYAVFVNTPELTTLNKYISQATKQISSRHETITPEKIIAELTLGFWVSLLNSEYERILWKDLRRAFPFIPKTKRQRKYVSAPLNRIRAFRNRVFHNESIYWNYHHIRNIHDEMLEVLQWMNRDVPLWMSQCDRFDVVMSGICQELGWPK